MSPASVSSMLSCMNFVTWFDFQTKSGFFVFPRHAKNGKILPFEVEQKVEIKGVAKISTELGYFSLIVNILHSKKTGGTTQKKSYIVALFLCIPDNDKDKGLNFLGKRKGNVFVKSWLF